MSEFWTAFGQALLILAATALFVVWVICTMVGVAGAIRRPEGSRYARFWCRASWLTVQRVIDGLLGGLDLSAEQRAKVPAALTEAVRREGLL